VGGWQRPGDSNQDGILNMADGVSLLGRLFSSASLPLPCEADSLTADGNRTLLDINNDTWVNIGDAVFLLNYLFRSGPPPTLGTDCVQIAGCLNGCSR
jgi:hypothetical protein